MGTTRSFIADNFDREMEVGNFQYLSSSGGDDYYATRCGSAIKTSDRWSYYHREMIEIE